jgi:hypothetical protein
LIAAAVRLSGDRAAASDWGVGMDDGSYHIACSTVASIRSRNFFAQIGANYARRAGPFAPRAGLNLYFDNGFNSPIDVQNRVEQIKIRIGTEERIFRAIRSDTWLQNWYFKESYLGFVVSASDDETMHVTTPDGRTYSYPLDGAAWALKAVAKGCDTTWP